MQAGSVIVATGFKHFDPGKETQMYGYYEFDDVITLVDTERMLKAGKFVRPSTGEPPKQFVSSNVLAAATGRSETSGVLRSVVGLPPRRQLRSEKCFLSVEFLSFTLI